MDQRIGTPLIPSSYGLQSTSRRISVLPFTTNQFHYISKVTVTNVATFHNNIATIVSISQLSQLCIENLRQLWKKPGYRHTLLQLSQFFSMKTATAAIDLRVNFSQLFKDNKNPNEKWLLLNETLISCSSQHSRVKHCQTL